jgi:CRP-like cAMP-binding protein
MFTFRIAGSSPSLLVYRDGSVIEMATIGREGGTGFQAVFGAKVSSARFFVQVPGTAAKMSRTAFQQAMEAIPPFRNLMHAHVHAFLEQVMVSAACNGAHSLSQRLARWLLMMRDRHDDETLPITHDLLDLARRAEAHHRAEDEPCLSAGEHPLDRRISNFLRIEVAGLGQAENDVSEREASSFDGLGPIADMRRDPLPSVVKRLTKHLQLARVVRRTSDELARFHHCNSSPSTPPPNTSTRPYMICKAGSRSGMRTRGRRAQTIRDAASARSDADRRLD